MKPTLLGKKRNASQIKKIEFPTTSPVDLTTEEDETINLHYKDSYDENKLWNYKEIKSIIRHNGDSNAKILWETDETTTEPIISKI